MNWGLNKFPEETLGPMIATAGMLAMRLGEPSEGVKRYREAIAYFKKVGHKAFEVLAFAYFAQEAARAGHPQAQSIYREAMDANKDVKFVPEAPIILERTATWLAAAAHRNELGRSA